MGGPVAIVMQERAANSRYMLGDIGSGRLNVFASSTVDNPGQKGRLFEFKLITDALRIDSRFTK